MNLTPKDRSVIENPQKVGNIRGSDAVFTWHPFDPEGVRSSAAEPKPKHFYTREYDRTKKIIKFIGGREIYSGSEEYKLTYFVQESLKPYELPSQQYLHPAKGQ